MKDECSLVFPAFLEFESELKRFIASRVNDPDLAEDLTNEIALKLYNNCRKIPEVTNLRSWLYTIARNTVIDHTRKQKREVALPASLDVTDSEPEDVACSSEKCLQTLIGQLPKHYRKPLLLSDYRGLSQLEVAKKLGLSYTTAKTRISRARATLRSLYQNNCQPHEVMDLNRITGIKVNE